MSVMEKSRLVTALLWLLWDDTQVWRGCSVGSSFCGGCVTVVLKFLLLLLRCYPDYRSPDSRLTTIKRNELVSCQHMWRMSRSGYSRKLKPKSRRSASHLSCERLSHVVIRLQMDSKFCLSEWGCVQPVCIQSTQTSLSSTTSYSVHWFSCIFHWNLGELPATDFVRFAFKITSNLNPRHSIFSSTTSYPFNYWTKLRKWAVLKKSRCLVNGMKHQQWRTKQSIPPSE